MDSARWRDVDRVLNVALESDPSGWGRVLDEHCSGDPDLRREVEALLDRYASARQYLESPPGAAAAALVREARRATYSSDRPRVDVYRIVREIGRGGTSHVFLAERDDGQYTQQVALKLLRPGFDSEIDKARFRAERQILASLNHPNIARLLDGGVTDDGLPYLVMELVDGQPIDKYCATHALTPGKRLEMFLTVAEATQYAHRNLVVHRDLKPSNILVTTDGQVKLLDFGLAKLLEQQAVDGSLPALTTQRWMTPEYAAPEQIRGQPSTTLTDVYQLGVVLYELLTGRLPFGSRQEGSYELQHAILEQEPAAPSDGTGHGELRGDVDAIVLKTLRKEADQRYDSPQALAEDVRRYLSGHAVLARHQTAGYRARRFARRNRWSLTAAAAGALTIAAYFGTVFAQRSRVERALAQVTVEAEKAEQVTDFVLGLFAGSEAGKAFADTVTARVLLSQGIARAREMTERPAVQGQMLDVIGQIHQQLGDYEQARIVYEEALAVRRRALGNDHLDVATTLLSLGNVAGHRNDRPAGITAHREAHAIRRRALGAEHPLTLESVYQLAYALHDSGNAAAARPLFDEWVAASMRNPGAVTVGQTVQLMQLGQLLQYRGELEAAERLYGQAIEARKRLQGPRHTDVGSALRDLGAVLRTRGKLVEAEAALRESAHILRANYPDGHPDLAMTMRSLAITLNMQKRYPEAVAQYLEVLKDMRRFFGEEHTFVGTTLESLGSVLRDQGDYARAEPYYRDALRIVAANMGDKSLMTMRVRIGLGDALRARGALREAESMLLDAYAAFRVRQMPGSGDWSKFYALEALVKLYEAQGRESEAARYRAVRDSVMSGLGRPQ